VDVQVSLQRGGLSAYTARGKGQRRRPVYKQRGFLYKPVGAYHGCGDGVYRTSVRAITCIPPQGRCYVRWCDGGVV
jgi:hypothetical protein